MMSRRDDINILYKPSKILKKTCTGLFLADIFISLATVYVPVDAISYLTLALVVIAFLYMALSVIDDGILWFRAENARRKNSIQTAYNTKLDSYETSGYYNNNIDDPELSYAINQFESAFFTKMISEKMLLAVMVKMLASVTILIISCRMIHNNDVFLIVAQAALSAVVIEDAIRHIIFTQRIRTLYEEAYHEFITIGISRNAQIVWLRYFCVEYESIKAYYRIRLNELLFQKMNPRLSEEWITMLEQIKISKIE
jgi:hypothetical protein